MDFSITGRACRRSTPARACRLRCLRCYSSSGPEERGGQPARLLREAIAGAEEEG
jgi:MoaA/NifB/PqqE/SkfB family radical SAM enzyme